MLTHQHVVSALLFVIVVGLSGCVFIPVPRKVLIQPPITFQVQDPTGQGIPEARIHFIVGSHPHHVLRSKQILVTDPKGRATLEEKRKWETIYPFMIHGVPEYYWTWCAEKEGYAPVAGGIYHGEVKPQVLVTLYQSHTSTICKQNRGRVEVSDK